MPMSVPLKWHGGKAYLAKKICSLMPEHIHYVEPFFGGGAVLLAKEPVVSELVNDLNKDLINFWRVLRHPDRFVEFQRMVQMTPLARNEWERARDGLKEYMDPVEIAWAFFVFCRQSLAGRMKSFTPPTRTRLRRGMNGNVSEWLSAVDGLPEVHARMRRVFVEDMDALKLIPREDGPGTLFYCDPPYLPETRSSPDIYACEMTIEGHVELLRILKACRGKVMLSGYASELYDSELSVWARHTFDMPNNSASGETKERKTEVLWCNHED